MFGLVGALISELLPVLADFAFLEGIEVEWSEHRAGSWESWESFSSDLPEKEKYLFCIICLIILSF